MNDVLSLIAQIGVYPVLALLIYRQDQAHKQYSALLDYLAKNCPYCRNVNLFSKAD